MSNSRYTLQITLKDNYGGEPLCMAVDLDEEIRISTRELGLTKAGFGTYEGTISLMRQREFRKELFIQTAERLGRLLAERMEDAEGWHDVSRIDPARKQLGGDWK